MSYIIKFPEQNLTTKQLKILNLITHDIKIIKNQIPQIDEIILHGGAVLSILYNKPIKDFDFLYSLKPKKRISYKHIINRIQNIKTFKFIKPSLVDVWNSQQILPFVRPIEIAIGYLSDHTEYFSMFAIKYDGMYTNIKALKDFNKKVYDINPISLMQWGFNKQEIKTRRNFIKVVGKILVRSAYYIKKYKLTPSQQFYIFYQSIKPLILNNIKQLQKDWNDFANKKGFKTYKEVLNNLDRIYGNIK